MILVNDGGTDGTEKVLLSLKKNLDRNKLIEIKILSYDTNRGKGFAIKKGILISRGDKILLSDADLSVPIKQLDKLLKFINDYDLVIGSRRQKGSKIIKPQSRTRMLLGRLFTFASRVILNVNVNDFTCGFKLIRKMAAKKIAKKMKINRWAYDAELLKIATIYGYKIKEIGVSWKNQEGTKVRLLTDIFTSFFDLIRIVYYALLKKYD